MDGLRSYINSRYCYSSSLLKELDLIYSLEIKHLICCSCQADILWKELGNHVKSNKYSIKWCKTPLPGFSGNTEQIKVLHQISNNCPARQDSLAWILAELAPILKVTKKELQATLSKNWEAHFPQMACKISKNYKIYKHIDQIHVFEQGYYCNSCGYSAYAKRTIQNHMYNKNKLYSAHDSNYIIVGPIQSPCEWKGGFYYIMDLKKSTTTSINTEFIELQKNTGAEQLWLKWKLHQDGAHKTKCKTDEGIVPPVLQKSGIHNFLS